MQEQTQKRKRGRPSNKDKQLTQSGEHWANRLLDLYKSGYSDAEICSDLQISEKEFIRRCREDELFCELVEIGRLFSKAWWMTQGRISLRDRSFSMQLWLANMKNRFGWTDKAEVALTDEKSLHDKSEEELINEILTKHRSRLSKVVGMDGTPLADMLHGKRKDN